jgi:uncharacterized membrane protein HdeD (DUF308 family)
MVVALGVISIAAGVLAIAYADITLRVLGLLVGIYLLIAGSVWIILAIEEEGTAGAHVLRLLLGILATLAGLICIVRPGASVLVVLLAVAYWFLLVGIADLARAILEPTGRWLSALFGVLGVTIGVLLIADPDIGVNTVALIVGIGFLLRGVLELAAGWFLRTA